MIKEHITIIKPNKSWLYINWKELFQYRDLLFLLVRRDFVARYKQTILGPLWFILQPLATTIVFTVIFNKVANISTDTLPPMLFYLSGIIMWKYFSDCLGRTSTSLTANAGIFGKVYFPRLIVPFSALISNLFGFFIQWVTFLGFVIFFNYFTSVGTSIQPNYFILFTPFYLLHAAGIGLGVGLWLSALTAKYKDFTYLMGFFTQLWMYGSPIIYPISLVSDKWKPFVMLNPIAPIIELFRYSYLGQGTLHLPYLLISLAVTFVLLVSGVLVFNKSERTFIDTF